MMNLNTTLCAVFVAAFAWPAAAQLTGLSVDVVTVHDGTIDPSLEGFTTYRVYADLTNELDFVSAVFGDASTPLLLGCDGIIFQSNGVNYNYANQVQPLFFGTFPQTEYDSWLTIGTENANGGVDIQSTDDTMLPALNLFNAGEGFIISDPIGASWFYVYPCSGASDLAACAQGNPAFGGADNRVLLAQITANGDIYGMFNLQVFPNGSQANTQTNIGQTFSSDATDVFGCTNMDATNYDPGANIDDLSCILPCTLVLSLDNVTGPSCNGENDALIQVSATGVQGADYFYLGSNDNFAQNFGNFGNLTAGLYNILVEDDAGCIDSLEVEVPVTGVVEVNTVLTSAVSCNGANDAVLTVESTDGGNGDFVYYISTNPTVLTDQTEWTDLASGFTYVVWAVDGNGCTGQSNPVYIDNPTPISVGLAPAGVIDASCADTPDGALYVVGYGGNAPTTIQFSVDGVNYGPSPLQVSGGTYTLSGRDAYGCIGTNALEVFVGPEAIQMAIETAEVACFGDSNGAISIETTGGVGQLHFTLNDSLESPAGQFSNLSAGEYWIEALDDNGCTSQELVTVESPNALQVDATIVEFVSSGQGSIVLDLSGGTPPYEVMWSSNSIVVGTGTSLLNLSSGIYVATITDGNDCTDIQVFQITTIDEGCTDPMACNFNQYALTEDGTCDYSCYGCTDENAFNFDPGATIDDGSCVSFEPGCDNIGMVGWDALEFDLYPEDTIRREYGLPTEVQLAVNVPPLIAEPLSGELFAVLTYSPESVLGLPNGLELQSMPSVIQGDDQACLVLEGTPSAEGLYLTELIGTLTLSFFGSPFLVENYSLDAWIEVVPNVNGITGCAYAFASNYNPFATMDDGSCVLLGCTEVGACNFNPFATSNDASCHFDCLGCTYPEASNFDAESTQDDGTCVFQNLSSCAFDANADSYIGTEDLLSFLGVFGSTCEP